MVFKNISFSTGIGISSPLAAAYFKRSLAICWAMPAAEQVPLGCDVFGNIGKRCLNHGGIPFPNPAQTLPACASPELNPTDLRREQAGIRRCCPDRAATSCGESSTGSTRQCRSSRHHEERGATVSMNPPDR